MAGDDPAVLRIQAGKPDCPLADVLVGSSVSAVTAYAILLVVLVRKSVHVHFRSHGLVECGVENCDLRHLRKDFLHRTDSEDVGRIVKWGIVAADGYLLHHILIDESRTAEEVSSLDDAVTHSIDLLEAGNHTADRIGQGGENHLHSLCVIGDRRDFDHRLLSYRLVGDLAVRKGYLFKVSFGEKAVIALAAHIKQLILDRGTSAIDY